MGRIVHDIRTMLMHFRQFLIIAMPAEEDIERLLLGWQRLEMAGEYHLQKQQQT